jgi:sugar transferase (PEP-CTERM system associated)
VLRLFGHYVSREQLLLVVGVGAIVVSSTRLGAVLPGLAAAPAREGGWAPAVATGALVACVLLMLHVAGVFEFHVGHGPTQLGVRVGLAFALAYVLIAASMFFLDGVGLERGVLASSFAVGGVATYGYRLTLARFEAAPRYRRKILLLGAGKIARLIAETMREASPRFELVGYVIGEGEPLPEDGALVAGSIAELDWLLKIHQPDAIVVAAEERRGVLPMETILACKLQGIEVDDWPTFYEKVTGKIHVDNLRPSWLVFGDGFRTAHLTRVMKRILDVLVALPACAVTALVTPAIALAIRLESRGPVFYRQERVGENGRTFSLVKFRTMREDAERSTGPVWATERDPRITRVGRVLRTTRLDELPQLFGVLRGEMSLVGPRPERPAFVTDLRDRIPFYACRHAVKPGITGWAQIRHRYGASIEDSREKLQYDLYYVKNLSIFLDLLILVQTIQVVVLGRGAR